MKTTFYVCIFLGIFLSASIGLSSCDKCPDKNDSVTYEYIEGKDLSVMGFTGEETLTYLKNNKDTIRFIGSGIQNYYTYATIPAGECEKDYKYGNKKIVFTNTLEGDIIFHRYYTDKFGVYYKVIFKRNIIGPLYPSDISYTPSISLFIKNKEFSNIKPFGSVTDSAYLFVTGDDLPIYRLPRIKLDTNIYEVIP